MIKLQRVALVAALLVAGAAQATPITLTGNYLQVSVSDYGTFGLNGGGRPAFVHDLTGTGTFDYDTDYIAPGSPHDGFSLISSQFGFTQNDNNGNGDALGLASPTLLTGLAARGYANAVAWTGGNEFLSITNSYFYNVGDERVLIETSITALSDLTNLAFARSVDPDSGTTSSINQRGNGSFSSDDFIGSESSSNGRTLAIYNVDSGDFEHTTQINGSCCSNINPYDVLSHSGSDLGLSSTGDNGLNIAYMIGTLNTGQTATFQYAYAAGSGIEQIEEPAAVPEPSSWAMMIGGFGLVGAMARRASRKAARSLA